MKKNIKVKKKSLSWPGDTDYKKKNISEKTKKV